MSHTPGDWIARPVEEGWVISSAKEGYVIATVHDYGPTGINHANWRLIVAAPELLTACEKALAWFNKEGWTGNGAADALRDAVAKAKGGL